MGRFEVLQSHYNVFLLCVQFVVKLFFCDYEVEFIIMQVTVNHVIYNYLIFIIFTVGSTCVNVEKCCLELF